MWHKEVRDCLPYPTQLSLLHTVVLLHALSLFLSFSCSLLSLPSPVFHLCVPVLSISSPHSSLLSPPLTPPSLPSSHSFPSHLQILDMLLWYLRLVHSVDFYGNSSVPNEDSMPHRCGIITVRNSKPGFTLHQDEGSCTHPLNAVQCNPVRGGVCGVVCGVVWCGVVWCSVVWCVVVWCVVW